MAELTIPTREILYVCFVRWLLVALNCTPSQVAARRPDESEGDGSPAAAGNDNWQIVAILKVRLIRLLA